MARYEDRTRLQQLRGEVSPRPGSLADADPGPGDPARAGSWDLEEVTARAAAHPARDAASPGAAVRRGLPPRYGAPAAPVRTASDDEPVEPRIPQWLSEPVGSVAIWQRLVPDRWRGVRLDPGRRGALVLAGVGVAAVLAAAVAVHRDDSAAPVAPLPVLRAAAESSTPPVAESPDLAVRSDPPDRSVPVSPGGGDLIVSVIGLVEHPGLMRVAAGARVADVVSRAVARDDADLGGLNLAQRLADGDQIVVGAQIPAAGPRLGSMVVASGPHTPASGGGAAPPPAPKVNLNTATEQDLDSLTGVGPTTAAAILAWRTQHGRFTTIDQLAEVTGIGPAKLSRLRDRVTV
ncbi:ComEA family DNA-binding protein [Nocardia spumae]|uniref:ComEA family DNA-binding protein n=1 Tax=Nocardia spumae TaxID=2887190 RepID=UPI001D141DFB|nr:ComEA family DNA-binding protein [Nocardia spumae]